ncbi:DUF2986 domain-containing protein [Shewanella canadensis]|uniref:DUF2986 domain-containing protein n=1 Tax=Shewanella canadensis TaxID=271096 RepID=A0A431WWF2_9GAMM|nr:DUF2986 domain-containing protein [Shewanella canadensis]RTR39748.1 DUF2986 domain-containing protein [Shewanella canadensis]
MNRTKKITLKHKAKTKKAKPRNGNKPVYVSKAEREVLATPEEAIKSVEASQD